MILWNFLYQKAFKKEEKNAYYYFKQLSEIAHAESLSYLSEADKEFIAGFRADEMMDCQLICFLFKLYKKGNQHKVKAWKYSISMLHCLCTIKKIL